MCMGGMNWWDHHVTEYLFGTELMMVDVRSLTFILITLVSKM